MTPSGISIKHIDKATFRRRLLLWYATTNRQLPWRRDWQIFKDPYFVWLSEILLQQTVMKVVLPAYDRITQALPNVRDFAAVSEEDLRRLCAGLGYYRRFRMMHKAAQALVGKSQIEAPIAWPRSYAEWLELDGIGPYTAAAISSITLDAAHAVVDGNVERVFCRLFDIRKPSNLPELKVLFQSLANEFLCTDQPGNYNQALMELGQLVCTPTQPKCDDCPVRFACKALENQSQALAPQPKQRRAFTDVYLDLLIVRDPKKRVGIWQRDERARFLKGSKGFALSEKTAAGRKVGTFKHHITHHRLNVRVVEVPRLVLGSDAREVEMLEHADLEKNLTTNLDRKAWKIYKSEFI